VWFTFQSLRMTARRIEPVFSHFFQFFQRNCPLFSHFSQLFLHNSRLFLPLSQFFISFLFSYSDLFLPTHFRCRGLLLHLVTHKTHLVGLPWTRDQHITETSTCTTHNTHKRKTFMSPAESELATPASQQPQSHALDRATTGIFSPRSSKIIVASSHFHHNSSGIIIFFSRLSYSSTSIIILYFHYIERQVLELQFGEFPIQPLADGQRILIVKYFIVQLMHSII